MRRLTDRSAEQFRALVATAKAATQRVSDHVNATMAAMDLDPADYVFDGTLLAFMPKSRPETGRIPSFVDEKDIETDPTRAEYESGMPPGFSADLPAPTRPPIPRPTPT
jgi:hypothetical protein